MPKRLPEQSLSKGEVFHCLGFTSQAVSSMLAPENRRMIGVSELFSYWLHNTKTHQ